MHMFIIAYIMSYYACLLVYFPSHLESLEEKKNVLLILIYPVLSIVPDIFIGVENIYWVSIN